MLQQKLADDYANHSGGFPKGTTASARLKGDLAIKYSRIGAQIPAECRVVECISQARRSDPSVGRHKCNLQVHLAGKVH